MGCGTVALSATTIAALIAYPLPFCIDCEYPNPWGDVSVRGEIPVTFWLLIAPFLAGALLMKRSIARPKAEYPDSYLNRRSDGRGYRSSGEKSTFQKSTS
jgi:hypothetical protein